VIKTKSHERDYKVRSESLCALGLRYVDMIVSTEVAVEACCSFSLFIC
jgi:hypothetical protein